MARTWMQPMHCAALNVCSSENPKKSKGYTQKAGQCTRLLLQILRPALILVAWLHPGEVAVGIVPLFAVHAIGLGVAVEGQMRAGLAELEAQVTRAVIRLEGITILQKWPPAKPLLHGLTRLVPGHAG